MSQRPTSYVPECDPTWEVDKRLDQLTQKRKRKELAPIVQVRPGYLSACNIWRLRKKLAGAFAPEHFDRIVLRGNFDYSDYVILEEIADLLGKSVTKSSQREHPNQRPERPVQLAELTMEFYKARRWEISDTYLEEDWRVLRRAGLSDGSNVFALALEVGALRLQRLTHQRKRELAALAVIDLERMRKDAQILGTKRLLVAASIAKRCISYHRRRTGQLADAIADSTQALQELEGVQCDRALLVDAVRNWFRNICTAVLAHKGETPDPSCVDEAEQVRKKLRKLVEGEPENTNIAAQVFMTRLAEPEFLVCTGRSGPADDLWTEIFNLPWVPGLLKQGIPDVNSRVTTTKVWWAWAQGGLDALAEAAQSQASDSSLLLFPERRKRMELVPPSAATGDLWMLRQLTHREVGN